MNNAAYHGVALFSGGLDSILAARLVMEQGLRIKCLHFVSPFFGKPHKLEHWKSIYGLDIDLVDINTEYAALLFSRPSFGFGKFLNPCVDCKILMATRARQLMAEYGARFIISGEVVGQRPMSQRRDTLNIITRESETRDLLLRPLCAKKLSPLPVEESGLVDRERLMSIGGRGRKEQLNLAGEYGLTEIPTPAGGCMLAEMESARRYWPVLKHASGPRAKDFHLANLGRQYWQGAYWLSVGRNKQDNERLAELAAPEDLVFKLKDFPGPLAIGRQFKGRGWPVEVVKDAAAHVAGFSPKARKSGGPVQVSVGQGQERELITVTPALVKDGGWHEPDWESAKEDLDAERQGS